MDTLTDLERSLLDDFQRDFPGVERPFQSLAQRLGVSEALVLETFASLQTRGFISRIGAVLQPNRAGASTLAAVAVPEHRLQEVAAIINGYEGVNHNYEREHNYNLWFVIGASNAESLEGAIASIEHAVGLPVLRLPLVEAYHIDLGFKIQWN
jgi:siroheme decarboxylase